jgi:hypothetical protein
LDIWRSRRNCLGLPLAAVPSLCRSPSHPVTDKFVEHFMASRVKGFEACPNMLSLRR